MPLNRRIKLNREPAVVVSELIVEMPVEISQPEPQKAIVSRQPVAKSDASGWAYAPGTQQRGSWKLPIRTAKEVRAALYNYARTDIPGDCRKYVFARIVEAAHHFGIIEEVDKLMDSTASIDAQQFVAMTGMNIQKPVIYCLACGAAPEFEANFTGVRTVECMNCHRIVTFEQFEKEQS